MYNIVLPEDVNFLMEKLKSHGYRADIVGGCVRDFLLGGKPSDYDITTSATPDKIKEVFSELRTVDTGIKHGTVTVILNGTPYEITTYRIDGEYLDNRHPKSVIYSSRIEEDLSRRDFTMNAIAYNRYDGLTDLFCGVDDIKNGIIRTVGEADRRFSEDALRILRAIRFSSVLGFEIEEKTAASARKNRSLLENVSKERIYSEWQKLIGGKSAFSVIEKYIDIINVFLPGIKGIPVITESAFLSLSPQERFAVLFLTADTEPSEASRTAMKSLKADTKSIDFISSVLECTSRIKCNNNTSEEVVFVNLLLYEYGYEVTRSALKISVAFGEAETELAEILEGLIERGSPYRISDLKIRGDDLARLGFSGKEIGERLEWLLLNVISGGIKNEKQQLIDFIKLYKTEK